MFLSEDELKILELALRHKGYYDLYEDEEVLLKKLQAYLEVMKTVG